MTQITWSLLKIVIRTALYLAMWTIAAGVWFVLGGIVGGTLYLIFKIFFHDFLYEYLGGKLTGNKAAREEQRKAVALAYQNEWYNKPGNEQYRPKDWYIKHPEFKKIDDANAKFVQIKKNLDALQDAQLLSKDKHDVLFANMKSLQKEYNEVALRQDFEKLEEYDQALNGILTDTYESLLARTERYSEPSTSLSIFAEENANASLFVPSPKGITPRLSQERNFGIDWDTNKLDALFEKADASSTAENTKAEFVPSPKGITPSLSQELNLGIDWERSELDESEVAFEAEKAKIEEQEKTNERNNVSFIGNWGAEWISRTMPEAAHLVSNTVGSLTQAAPVQKAVKPATPKALPKAEPQPVEAARDLSTVSPIINVETDEGSASQEFNTMNLYDSSPKASAISVQATPAVSKDQPVVKPSETAVMTTAEPLPMAAFTKEDLAKTREKYPAQKLKEDAFGTLLVTAPVSSEPSKPASHSVAARQPTPKAIASSSSTIASEPVSSASHLESFVTVRSVSAPFMKGQKRTTYF